MNSSGMMTHQIAIEDLGRFIRTLVVGLVGKEGWNEQAQAILIAAVQAQCAQCAIPLTVDELIASAGEETPSSAALAKVSRLRQGYCARNGCLSRFYQVNLLPYPGVIWAEVLARAAAINQEQAAALQVEEAENEIQRRRESRTKGLKLLGTLGGLLLLLVARQWLVGGRIPLLREPQTFRGARSSVLPGAACHDPKCPVCAMLRQSGTNSAGTNRTRTSPPLEIVLPR
jgi:hypothetical protein